MPFGFEEFYLYIELILAREHTEKSLFRPFSTLLLVFYLFSLSLLPLLCDEVAGDMTFIVWTNIFDLTNCGISKANLKNDFTSYVIRIQTIDKRLAN